MALKDMLLQEFDQEMGVTRKYLERVPMDKAGWKPHEKSGTMIWLAAHIAGAPEWAALALTADSLDVAPGGVPAPRPPRRRPPMNCSRFSTKTSGPPARRSPRPRTRVWLNRGPCS